MREKTRLPWRHQISSPSGPSFFLPISPSTPNPLQNTPPLPPISNILCCLHIFNNTHCALSFFFCNPLSLIPPKCSSTREVRAITEDEAFGLKTRGRSFPLHMGLTPSLATDVKHGH